jgi:hypothetical protein
MSLIQSVHQPQFEVSVSDDVMTGQRQASIYDQVDETQLYNDIDETQVCNDLVDYDYTVFSDANVLAHSDQLAQQAERRSKLVMFVFISFL